MKHKRVSIERSPTEISPIKDSKKEVIRYCSRCGGEINESIAKFCYHCGLKLNNNENVVPYG
ncbi:MAG: hypothetical protein ACFE9Z_14060 [Promethearchaeota archaeon]